MKVKNLIAQLQNLNPESDVFLSRDAEGNGFEELYSTAKAIIQDGEMYDLSWSADDCSLELEEWETLKEGKIDVVLWP